MTYIEDTIIGAIVLGLAVLVIIFAFFGGR